MEEVSGVVTLLDLYDAVVVVSVGCGVDTPETVDPNRPPGCFGKEASDRNKQLVDGKTVYLEKEVSETDRFGRLLRYVYQRTATWSTRCSCAKATPKSRPSRPT